MRSRLFFLISLSFSACLAAAPAKRLEIDYELSRNGAPVAESVERLEHDGKTYRIAMHLKGKGIFALRGDASRSSRGKVGPDGLRPAEFEDKRSGRDTVTARFDWTAHTLTLQTGAGAPESKPLPPHAQDRLSFPYSFAFRPPVRATAEFSVTDGKGISSSVYEADGTEALKTPAGEFETVKLKRRKNSPDDRSTEIWLAAKHGFVPVRILVVEKNGTRLDQVATRVAEQ